MVKVCSVLWRYVWKKEKMQKSVLLACCFVAPEKIPIKSVLLLAKEKKRHIGRLCGKEGIVYREKGQIR
jgi:hypothetical protein